MSNSTPEWVNRVIKEVEDLERKIDKLAKFLNTDKYKQLSSKQQALLSEQLPAMWIYRRILVQRIEDYAKETKGETK